MDDLTLASELVDRARKAGADEADVLLVRDAGVSVGVSGGELEEVERAEAREAGLRVIINRQQACVSSSSLSDAAIETMVERAIEMAKAAPQDPNCGLAEQHDGFAPEAVAALDLLDPSDLMDAATLEARALDAEAAALETTGINQVEQAHASAGRVDITLVTSTGFAGGYGRTNTGIGVSCIAGEGLGRERDYAGEYRRHAGELPDAGWIGRRAANRAVARLSPRKPPAGSYPVLFDERVSSSLVSHVLAAVNGSAVARGSSWLREAMGTGILPEGLDLMEDPLVVRGATSRPFDAEGIAAQRRPIVEGGRLVRWVLDSATARKLDLTTTGNARRGTSSPPSPGVSNVRLTQGTRSPGDLIADMGTGLVVNSMIGSSVNPTTGAYSRGASGFWVENGEIAYPVNEITIAGSLPEFMRTIVPADDMDLNRSIAASSLLVEGLTVGA